MAVRVRFLTNTIRINNLKRTRDRKKNNWNWRQATLNAMARPFTARRSNIQIIKWNFHRRSIQIYIPTPTTGLILLNKKNRKCSTMATTAVTRATCEEKLVELNSMSIAGKFFSPLPRPPRTS